MIRKWWGKYRINIYYVIWIMLAGTILHFVYEWSGYNAFVALFSPVNESVWEHLKLFFMPAFLFTVFYYYRIGEKNQDYLWCQTKSILAGMGLIIVIYFTYLGIVKQECVWIDIGIFYLSAAGAGVIAGKCSSQMHDGNIEYRKYASIILLLFWALFVWFTYRIPEPLLKWLPGLFLSEA